MLDGNLFDGGWNAQDGDVEFILGKGEQLRWEILVHQRIVALIFFLFSEHIEGSHERAIGIVAGKQA